MARPLRYDVVRTTPRQETLRRTSSGENVPGPTRTLHPGQTSWYRRPRHCPSGQKPAHRKSTPLVRLPQTPIANSRSSQGSVVVCKVIPHLRSHGYRDSELFFLRDALPPHARIINLQSALTSPYQTQLYLDYCTGGDLASFIESHHYKLTGASVPEAFIWHAFLQLGEALAFIHHGHDRARKRPLEPWRAVIHRDVKPANILLQRAAFDPDHPGLEPYPRLVLADFGLALQADAPGALPESTCSVGTFAYQPPECPLHSAKGDVWAAGAIVYEMCTGNVPFDEQLPASVCDAEAFRTWLAGLGQRERWALFAVEGAGYSRALGNVLRKALEVDVRRRVGSVEL
ncbi:MAG: hypothetical protein Q9206_006865, partial [Seirophora lacunosa]